MGIRIKYFIFLLIVTQSIQSQKNIEVEYGVAFNHMAIDTSKISDPNVKGHVVRSENEARRSLQYDKTLAVLKYDAIDEKVIFNFIDIMRIDGKRPISLHMKGIYEFTHNLRDNTLILTQNDEVINPKKLKWTLKDDFKYILNYKCQKSITYLKTRNGDNKKIVAWFTSKIPVSSGPFIYSGLPGLILEIDTHTGRKIYARKIDID